jgi:hypothetical protein
MKIALKMTPSVIKLGPCSICGGKGYSVRELPGKKPVFFCEFHTRERWKKEALK